MVRLIHDYYILWFSSCSSFHRYTHTLSLCTLWRLTVARSHRSNTHGSMPTLFYHVFLWPKHPYQKKISIYQNEILRWQRQKNQRETKMWKLVKKKLCIVVNDQLDRLAFSSFLNSRWQMIWMRQKSLTFCLTNIQFTHTHTNTRDNPHR